MVIRDIRVDTFIEIITINEINLTYYNIKTKFYNNHKTMYLNYIYIYICVCLYVYILTELYTIYNKY